MSRPALLRRFDLNPKGVDWFVGDIHGSVSRLVSALKARGFNFDADRLFAVGDLIDRGPESRRALDLLKTDWFFSVMGNHEDFLTRGSGHEDSLWYINGGGWAFDEIMQRAPDIADYEALVLRECPLAMEVVTGAGRIGVIHTDPPDDWDMLEAYNAARYLWGRTRVKGRQASQIAHIDYVVFGHTPSVELSRYGNSINLDTGACFKEGRFTILRADEVIA